MSSKLTVDVWWERGFLHGVALERLTSWCLCHALVTSDKPVGVGGLLTLVLPREVHSKERDGMVSKGFLIFEMKCIQVISAPPKTRSLSR